MKTDDGNEKDIFVCDNSAEAMIFYLNPEGKACSVESGDGFEAVREAVIPEKYRGLPVTAIEKEGFYESSALVRMTIPAGIKSIGEAAFMYCASLEDVYYGGSREEAKNICIAENNEPLLNAVWHYAE